jgi:YfiH family protein
MAGWERKTIGRLSVDVDKVMNWLPHLAQGFTTRKGGTSEAPYSSLNLGDHVGDDIKAVEANRLALYEAVGFENGKVALAEQVHGAEIADVSVGGKYPGCDALVTNTPGLLLVLFYADCVPVYLVDPHRRAIGLVHAGWRGVKAGIAPKTVEYLGARYGVKPENLRASIGPSIAGESYEVGAELADVFRNLMPGGMSGAATPVVPRGALADKYSLDLRLILFAQLMSAGISADSISVSDADTFRQSKDYFSYRRDGAKTGRMAAYLGLKG